MSLPLKCGGKRLMHLIRLTSDFIMTLANKCSEILYTILVNEGCCITDPGLSISSKKKLVNCFRGIDS